MIVTVIVIVIVIVIVTVTGTGSGFRGRYSRGSDGRCRRFGSWRRAARKGGGAHA
jgi:hypothetical protein